MAIIIEEEKSKSSLVNLVGWLAILVIIGAAVYYIFFVSPEAAIIAPAANFGGIGQISQANSNAQGILNNAEFLSLQQHVSPTSTFGGASVGRSNPFVSP